MANEWSRLEWWRCRLSFWWYQHARPATLRARRAHQRRWEARKRADVERKQAVRALWARHFKEV